MKATREAVFNAADTLIDAGETASVAAVRRAIGGGSFTTIQTYLMEWREGHRIPPASAAMSALPADLEDGLQRLGRTVWERACAGAHERLASERAALDVMQAQHEAARREATALADQLSGELDRLQATHAALAQEATTTRDDLAEARRALAVLQARLDDVQGQAAQLRTAEHAAVEQAAALRGHLEALEAQNAALLARVAPKGGARGASSKDSRSDTRG